MLFLTSCNFLDVVAIIIISIFHRCVWKFSLAQTLNVKVKFAPHIRDSDLETGYLESDVCIQNINTPVDSINAICRLEPDKEPIHADINSRFSNGFEEINAGVEKVRLEYLLENPVHKITVKDVRKYGHLNCLRLA